MIKEACLLNVVCVNAKLDFTMENQDYVEISGNNAGTCKKIREYIYKARDTFFNVLEERDGIYYGDIILSNSDGNHSLIDVLVKERILAVNIPLFQKGMLLNYYFLCLRISLVMNNMSFCHTNHQLQIFLEIFVHICKFGNYFVYTIGKY